MEVREVFFHGLFYNDDKPILDAFTIQSCNKTVVIKMEDQRNGMDSFPLVQSKGTSFVLKKN